MNAFQNHTFEGYLTGRLLAAMPQMKDSRFAQSVIYICGHDENGAMGLVINKLIESISLSDLLMQLGIPASLESACIPVFLGGPVETGRGFVLHTTDYLHETSIRVSPDIAVTATLDILSTIARGEGPREKICALGYAGWSGGQLEAEVMANAWLQVPADTNILFHEALQDRWRKTISRLGVTPEDLAWDAGHA